MSDWLKNKSRMSKPHGNSCVKSAYRIVAAMMLVTLLMLVFLVPILSVTSAGQDCCTVAELCSPCALVAGKARILEQIGRVVIIAVLFGFLLSAIAIFEGYSRESSKSPVNLIVTKSRMNN